MTTYKFLEPIPSNIDPPPELWAEVRRLLTAAYHASLFGFVVGIVRSPNVAIGLGCFGAILGVLWCYIGGKVNGQWSGWLLPVALIGYLLWSPLVQRIMEQLKEMR